MPRRAQAQEDYYECLHHKKEFTRRNEAVSYTHLTLPTILLV